MEQLQSGRPAAGAPGQRGRGLRERAPARRRPGTAPRPPRIGSGDPRRRAGRSSPDTNSREVLRFGGRRLPSRTCTRRGRRVRKRSRATSARVPAISCRSSTTRWTARAGACSKARDQGGRSRPYGRPPRAIGSPRTEPSAWAEVRDEGRFLGVLGARRRYQAEGAEEAAATRLSSVVLPLPAGPSTSPTGGRRRTDQRLLDAMSRKTSGVGTAHLFCEDDSHHCQELPPVGVRLDQPGRLCHRH